MPEYLSVKVAILENVYSIICSLAMKTRLRKLWDALRSNYWFVPLTMMVLAFMLWLGTKTVDRLLTAKDKGSVAWLYVDTIDSMRTLLLTIDGTIIGIIGVVFSIMMIPLTIAASQFGPRLLRTFLRDIGTQITLGTFTATFLFCTLVLLQLRGLTERHLPQISATAGLLLGIISFAVLIFFINHVAISLQVTNLVFKVGKEINTAVDHDLPDHLDNAFVSSHSDTNNESEILTKNSWVVNATASGYLQVRDDETLLQIAQKHNLVLKLLGQPGDFIIDNTPLVIVWAEAAASKQTDLVIHSSFVLGAQRTLVQDITFGINELVEVAIRALSPAINDPFTAMTCLDWLGSVLCRICTRAFPQPKVFDKAGCLRLIRNPVNFASLADAAFNQIREYGRTSAAVTLRLIDTIAVVEQCARTEEQRSILLHHAILVERGCHAGLPEEADRQLVTARFNKMRGMVAK